jgi:hypothetical protein
MGFDEQFELHELALLRLCLDRTASGPRFSPIECNDECPIRRTCPFLKMDRRPPDGTSCPWEEMVAENRFDSLCGVFGVDDLESIDAAILRELVNWEAMETRFHGEYSDNPKTAEKVLRGIDPNGEPIFDIKTNPVIRHIEKASARKAKLMESMLATRLDKSKHAELREAKDASTLAAEYARRIEDMNREMRDKRKLIVERQGEIEDAEFIVNED